MAEASRDDREGGGGGRAHESSTGGDNDASLTGLRVADRVDRSADRYDSEGGSVVWINVRPLSEKLQAEISSYLAGAPALLVQPTDFPALRECQSSLPEGLISDEKDAIDALFMLSQPSRVLKPQSQKVNIEESPRHVELHPAVTRSDKDRSKASPAANAPAIAPVLGVAIPKRRRSEYHRYGKFLRLPALLTKGTC